MRRLLVVAAACHAAGYPWRKRARDTGREARKRAARRLEALFHAFDAEETKPDGFMVGGETDGAGQSAERSWEFHRPEKIKKVVSGVVARHVRSPAGVEREGFRRERRLSPIDVDASGRPIIYRS